MTQARISIEGEEDAFDQMGEDTVLRAALRAGIGFPYECNSGGCGSCRFDVLEGEVENLWPDAPGLTERDRRRGRLLACQCRTNTNLCIKVRTAPEYRSVIQPKRFRASFIAMHEITHDIREFRFVANGKADFLAGQYVMLAIPGVTTPRAYSMSNISNDEGQWHFQIRRVANGAATDKLFHHLHAGDEIEIDGPYGLAYLRTDIPRDIVCVAGGSGLAPMVSIARGAAQSSMLKTRQLHFFYGGRTPRDICGETFLRELPGYGERIHFYPVVSLPGENSGTHWNGETGFVHELVRRVFGDSLPNFEFYFAGPPPMTQTLQEMLMVGYRVPFEQIHFDRFF
ncbi:MAG: 2Fe-2S iron-sulfur cluster binding domain-containing protein [Burkholderiales bacterium]|nr:2Fe-2S iron-sulfur cluster binding domain-containing protein [Burkholderiales bacterium]